MERYKNDHTQFITQINELRKNSQSENQNNESHNLNSQAQDHQRENSATITQEIKSVKFNNMTFSTRKSDSIL